MCTGMGGALCCLCVYSGSVQGFGMFIGFAPDDVGMRTCSSPCGTTSRLGQCRHSAALLACETLASVVLLRTRQCPWSLPLCRAVLWHAGGTAFVTTQAISWSIFAATVVMLVVLLQQLLAGVAHCFRCWALGAGTCMVMAQAVSRCC